MGSGVIFRGHFVRYFSRASATARLNNAHLFLQCFGPLVITERVSLSDRAAKCLKFGVGLRLVHVKSPVERTVNGPFCEPCGVRVVPPPETGPLPLFGSWDKRRANGISFDITAYPQEVVVVRDR